jgi:hypothetical protein
MILTNVLKAFSNKTKGNVEQVVAALPEAAKPELKDHDAIVNKLMGKYLSFKHAGNTVAVQPESTSKSFKSTAGFQMYPQKDGAYIARDEQGNIVKTRDVLRRVKEYRHENGELLVQKFGVWNKLHNGRVLLDGTLVWRTAEREIHELLDGNTVSISFKAESLIAHNDKTGEEVAITREGELRHLLKEDGVETFRVYRHNLLKTELVTYTEPVSYNVITKAGGQQLHPIYRVERHFENGSLCSEVFSFADQFVRISMEVPSGDLHLSRVKSLENIYVNNVLSETIFALGEPVSVSRNKDGSDSLITGISKVRSFQMRDDINAVVFVDHNGDENLYFPPV